MIGCLSCIGKTVGCWATGGRMTDVVFNVEGFSTTSSRLAWHKLQICISQGVLFVKSCTVHFFSHEKTNQKSDRLRILKAASPVRRAHFNGPCTSESCIMVVTGMKCSGPPAGLHSEFVMPDGEK